MVSVPSHHDIWHKYDAHHYEFFRRVNLFYLSFYSHFSARTERMQHLIKIQFQFEDFTSYLARMQSIYIRIAKSFAGNSNQRATSA